jgi:hypothetical protein
MSEARSALKIIRLPGFIYFAAQKNVEKNLRENIRSTARKANGVTGSTRVG